MSVAEENRSLRLAALHQQGEIGALVRLFCHIRDLSDDGRTLLGPVFRALLEQARDGIPAGCWPVGPVGLLLPPGEPLDRDMEQAVRAFGGLCEELSEHALAWGVSLALPLDTTDSREVWRRASALEKTGQFTEALALLDGLDERDPTLAAAVFDTRGAILCRQGDYPGAVAVYREALAREPSRVETTCALSYGLHRLGEGEEAIALANHSLDLAANPLGSFLLDLYADRAGSNSAAAPPGPARLVRDAAGTCISYSFMGDEHAAAFAAAAERS
jgi:tetratricopeptide (TPR) repeat protein